MAVGSRPALGGKSEIEAADDFILGSATTLTSASFTGLITGSGSLASIGAVGVEIYRVFPLDSNNPPSGAVPTRTNSPSDVAFTEVGTLAGTMSLNVTTLNPSFTAANSVLNGIFPSPNQTTGGEGPITGMEILFNVNFTTSINLPAGHYFFVPQVQVTTPGSEFMWLSAASNQFAGDLQMWIRNDNLDPNWLRVGTDIVGGVPAPTFNGAFSLAGTTNTGASAPDSGNALILSGLALGLLGGFRRIVRQRVR